MSEEDIERVIRYHLSPINISFHTTNPGLRCQMLNNRFAGDIFEKVQRLYDAGITMNGQIVLCKGLNDGDELERSIRDLTRYLPLLESVSVVPVGLTKYRDGLYPLEPFEKEDASQVLRTVHAWQENSGQTITHILCTAVTSGISWQVRNCRKQRDTTVIFSSRMVWECCGC